MSLQNAGIPFLCICFFSLIVGFPAYAQTDSLSTREVLGGDGYREGQYPGLGRAASEIFYSKNRVTFSGYLEVANVLNGGAPRDVSSGELELYFSQLYRLVPFISIRLTKKWFLVTEWGMEYFEGNGENEFHFFPEVYTDIIFKSWMSFRLGIQPLNIGYINNNDEPVLFLSVNRPETERIIIPSEWIEVGFTLYGEIFPRLNYALGFSNGLLGRKFTSPLWIRNGSETQYESFNRVAIHGQLNYLPVDNVTLSLSGYFNQTGRGQEIEDNGVTRKVEAPLSLISGYARADFNWFGIIAMGVYGRLSDTRELLRLTAQEQGDAQILGQSVYGFYVEPSIDLFKLFGYKNSSTPKAGALFSIQDSALPVFVRYERLDTHAGLLDTFLGDEFIRSNLSIWMVGLNYKPNHLLALKFNVRFRENLSPSEGVPASETLYELGLGIEF